MADLTEVVLVEETSTQVELAFNQALDGEGLMDAVEARHDDGRIDLTTDDEQRPILLAVSDNGPQMTSGSSREFLALCAEEDLASDGRVVGRRTLLGGHVTTAATQRCLPQDMATRPLRRPPSATSSRPSLARRYR